MSDCAFFLIVDDRYWGPGQALALRLSRLWHLDVHVFLENGREQHPAQAIADRVFLHRNLLKGIRPEGLPATHNWPPVVYDRIFAPRFLTEYRRVIYLDADIYPLAAAAEVLHIPLPHGLAAVQDIALVGSSPRASGLDRDAWRRSIGLRGQRYFNSGVLVIDPAAWVKTDFAAALRAYAAAYGKGIRMPDQDFLNYQFQNCWTELSPRFNYQEAHFNYGYERLFRPVFLHFSSVHKPWLRPDRPECVHGQFFPVYQRMFAQAGIDHREYMQEKRERVLRRWRTQLRYGLSQLGLVTNKERRQRREWETRSATMFRKIAEDGAAGRYADMDFTLSEMPRPKLTFDGRYLRRALEVSVDDI